MDAIPFDPSTIPGWGVDADPRNDPTYPMRDRSADRAGMTWERPPLQEADVEVLQSIERNELSAVFGTSTPPAGASGMIRRGAFRYSESEWAHWLMLMFADRVNVVEGLAEDLAHGRVPNILAEMGIRSEIRHNLPGLARKIAITGAVVALAVLAYRMMSDRGDAEPNHRLPR